MSVKILSPSSSLPLLAITNPPCSAVSATAELFVTVVMCCAVSVDARVDVNVALNRPSYQMSTMTTSDGHTHIAAQANDGNRDPVIGSFSCVHTDSETETNPWWTVDLGVPLYVHSVKFTNRVVGRTYMLSSMSVEHDMALITVSLQALSLAAVVLT